jgi:hypothetical protein
LPSLLEKESFKKQAGAPNSCEGAQQCMLAFLWPVSLHCILKFGRVVGEHAFFIPYFISAFKFLLLNCQNNVNIFVDCQRMIK